MCVVRATGAVLSVMRRRDGAFSADLQNRPKTADFYIEAIWVGFTRSSLSGVWWYEVL